MKHPLARTGEGLRGPPQGRKRCQGPNPGYSHFIAGEFPSARRKAEDHFNKAIEVAREIGAKGVLGQIYLDLGLLHMAKNKKDEARVCLSEAVGLFEQCEANVYLKQAQEVLERLG